MLSSLKQFENDLVSTKDSRKALNLLYTKIDSLLSVSDFAMCDLLLKEISLVNLSNELLIGLLSSTLLAADKLPYRATLFNNIHTELNIRKVSKFMIATLLLGLETPVKVPKVEQIKPKICNPTDHAFGSLGECSKCGSHRDPVRYGT